MRRVGQAAITLFGVATFNFWLFRMLPGNPLRVIAREGRLSMEAVESLKIQFGLDGSIWSQYLRYLTKIFRFDTGISFRTRSPVADSIVPALNNTLILVGFSIILIFAIGLAIGITAGWRRGTRTDSVLTLTALTLWSLPTFWVGMILVLVFSIQFGVLPVAGIRSVAGIYSGPFDEAADILRHLILPGVTIALVSVGQIALVMRNSLAEVMDEDYMLAARSRGLRPRVVLWRHGVRNAFLPSFTLMALTLGMLMVGTIQTEAVFSWPGLGLLMFKAVGDRDFPILEASFFVIAVIVVLGTLVADLFYSRLDPRIRST
ncbi:MAG: peptide ABC transporter permease [Dehalococcoidia bacterium]|nr:peptide ABC transporter permease [Dehalococcoidia bacterium]